MSICNISKHVHKFKLCLQRNLGAAQLNLNIHRKLISCFWFYFIVINAKYIKWDLKFLRIQNPSEKKSLRQFKIPTRRN